MKIVYGFSTHIIWMDVVAWNLLLHKSVQFQSWRRKKIILLLKDGKSKALIARVEHAFLLNEFGLKLPRLHENIVFVCWTVKDVGISILANDWMRKFYRFLVGISFVHSLILFNGRPWLKSLSFHALINTADSANINILTRTKCQPFAHHQAHISIQDFYLYKKNVPN